MGGGEVDFRIDLLIVLLVTLGVVALPSKFTPDKRAGVVRGRVGFCPSGIARFLALSSRAHLTCIQERRYTPFGSVCRGISARATVGAPPQFTVICGCAAAAVAVLAEQPPTGIFLASSCSAAHKLSYDPSPQLLVLTD